MAVCSALPWPFRWIMLAIVVGFCAAIALWAFEFGKDLVGLDQGNKAQLLQVRLENDALLGELEALKDERNKAQSVANIADTLLTAERGSQEKLMALNRQLEADNQRLKSDLGFFEQLIPASGTAGISIRGLQAQLQSTGEVKWQVLVIQAVKNPAQFKGQLELSFAGLENGKPWSEKLPARPQPVAVTQHGRLEGLCAVPLNVMVKSVTARVFEGQTVRAVQTLKL